MIAAPHTGASAKQMPRTLSLPRPFLKWAGGKGKLLSELVSRLPDRFASYHEPFVGSGALFFQLIRSGRFGGSVCLSDVNAALIDTYLAVQGNVDAVIEILRVHQSNNSKEYFYEIRKLEPENLTLAESAARVIYLNKTCYNGLYRENRKGQFNVPYGRHNNPTICDEANLPAVSEALKGVQIERRSFRTIEDYAVEGDLVYFDPPYDPVSPTASFTSYDRNGFAREDQIHLRDVFTALDRHGVFVMLSNSSTPFIRELYAGFHFDEVHAPRFVNSRADRRGPVPELIIRNYS